MLKIENLSIQYMHNEKPSVTDFNLEMKPGEIVSLVGESGSGKSTVLKAIINALPAEGRITDGSIYFKGEDMKNFTNEKWRSVRGSDLSVIFQDASGSLNQIRTIGGQFTEYIRTHDKEISKESAKQKAVEMLAMMHLPEPEKIMKKYAFQLSGGMKQRVAIAMAMTFHPALLLADEPTSALDVTTQAQIIRQMMELRDKENTGILIVTHNLGVAAYMSDYIIVMKDGKITEEGTREEVLENPEDEYTRRLLSAVPGMRGDRLV